MARRGIAICLEATIMVLVLWGEVAAQSSDCTNTLISLSPCLDYITGKSSKPSSRCCSKLGTVVKSQLEYLCQVLTGGGSSMGIIINQTQALALPGACDVKNPSISSCNDYHRTFIHGKMRCVGQSKISPQEMVTPWRLKIKVIPQRFRCNHDLLW